MFQRLLEFSDSNFSNPMSGLTDVALAIASSKTKQSALQSLAILKLMDFRLGNTEERGLAFHLFRLPHCLFLRALCFRFLLPLVRAVRALISEAPLNEFFQIPFLFLMEELNRAHTLPEDLLISLCSRLRSEIAECPICLSLLVCPSLSPERPRSARCPSSKIWSRCCFAMEC